MASIESIVADFKYGRAEILRAIAGLSEAELTEVLVYEAWTIKDILAHLIGWDEWVISILPLITEARADEIPLINREAYNQQTLNLWQTKSVDEIQQKLQETHEAVVHMLSNLDYVEIDTRHERDGRVITIRSYVVDVVEEHERQHAAEILAWRKEKGL